MWATARRHPAMMELLIEQGADVNARSIHRDYQRRVTAEGRPKSLDSGGFTPLLYAARENCIACVDVLLAHGADIDLPDPDGVSPLHVAVMNANWDLARQLIEAGADVNQWDIYGAAPAVHGRRAAHRIDGGRASIDPLNETSGSGYRAHAARARRQPEHAALLPPGERARFDQYPRLDAADPCGDQRRYGSHPAAARSTAPMPRCTRPTARRRSTRCSPAARTSARRWS
jgi:hypothetical protein